VLGGQRHVHRVFEQGHRAQPGPGALPRSRELEQQRQIELAGAQPGPDLLRLALGQRQPHLWVGLAEAGHGKRHQGGPGRGERGDPQPASAHPEHRRQVGLGGLDLSEDRLGMTDQRRPGLGRPHASAVTDDERRPSLGLEPGDRLRDGRLRVGEGLRSGRKRPPADHLAEHLEPAEVQH
jgi:hypothetical protein